MRGDEWQKEKVGITNSSRKMVGDSSRVIREVKSGEYSKRLATEWQDIMPEILIA